MGIIPLCFKAGEDAETLGLTGEEKFNIELPDSVAEIRPGQDIAVTTDSGKAFTCTVRFDTEVSLSPPHSALSLTLSLFLSFFLSLSLSLSLSSATHAHALFLSPSLSLSLSLIVILTLDSDTVQVELAYFNNGGILPYVIRNLIKADS